MQKVELTIRALSYSNKQSGAYALILSEVDGSREIPVIIGSAEAQAIAIALEKTVNPPRPLTHDLFKNFSQAFHIHLHEVVIHDIIDGVFFASLICKQDNKELSIDSRPSDAVALAIRFRCPIYTSEEVLEKAGLILDDGQKSQSVSTQSSTESKAKPKKSQDPIKEASISQLNKMLGDAVNQEDYEKAARIRDEIEKRQD